MTHIHRIKFVAPGDDYALRTTWAAILEPHGWVWLRSNDSRGDVWDRPGRTSAAGHTGGCANTRERGGLWVFTTSTKFKARTLYGKFGAYAVLNHDGNRQAAAEALHVRGFGVFRERDEDGNQIIRCGKYSYTWPGDREPLAVGDIVVLPAVSERDRPFFGDEPREDTVTHLGTGYSGRLVEVVNLVTRAPAHDPENPDGASGPPSQ